MKIEKEELINAMNVAQHFFSAHERAALAALPAGDRMRRFYRVWTRKESFVKALGDGVSCPSTRST